MSIKVKFQLEADGEFPCVLEKHDTRFYTKKTIVSRNNIPADFRALSSTETTLCYVTDLGIIYELINNPVGLTTNDDWEERFSANLSPEKLIGTWKADNTDPVLADTGALNRNGEYYLVTGAPTGIEVTFPGLFEGNTKTVKDGDFIISAGSYWVHRPFNPQIVIPEELLVTQFVDNITERNALTRWVGMRVIVLDSTGDNSADTEDGEPAEYLYNPSNSNADSEGFVVIPNSSIDVLATLIENGKLKDIYIPDDLRGYLGEAPYVGADDAVDMGASMIYTYTGSSTVNWNLPAPASGPTMMLLNVPNSGAQVRLNPAGSNQIYGGSGTTPYPANGKNSFIIFNDGIRYAIK